MRRPHLLNLILAATALASEEQFEELANNKFCSAATNTVAITSEAECRAASAKLKLVFAKAWNGPGSFPGCMHCNDGRDTVYWNTSPTPSPIPNRPLYGAICRSASATKRPVPGDNGGGRATAGGTGALPPAAGSPFECGSHMSGRTPVWLNGPSKPVELISPNFPNAFNASNLECIWEVRARFGTKVKVTFITADMGSDCMSNTLKVFDTSSSRQLSGSGLEAKCGKNPFPPAYDPIESDGPVTIKFKSLGLDGTAKFKIIVEATQPNCDLPTYDTKAPQPNGCTDPCSGQPCHLKLTPEGQLNLTSPNYPQDSGSSKSCSWTLIAPIGYSVALNFLDMDTRIDYVGPDYCTEDYVQVTGLNTLGKMDAGPQAVIPYSGKKFCGDQVPNYPGPSQIVMDNKMTVTFVTDKSNVRRGRGFAAVATAVNPLCTDISYTLSYSDKSCDATCQPFTILPTKQKQYCSGSGYQVSMKVIILKANSTTPVSGATVGIKTLNQLAPADDPYWTQPDQISVKRRTNLDGSVSQLVNELSTYKIKVTANGFFPHFVDVNITCQTTSYCGDCKPEAVIELEPVPIEPCHDIKMVVTLKDFDSKKPVGGATVSITYENKNQTLMAVEDALTNPEGQLHLEMTPVTKYTVLVSKEPYFPFNKTIDATCDAKNCSGCLDLSLDAPLKKPKCKEVNMTISVNDKINGAPIKDAIVKVVIVSTQEVVAKDLKTDKDGKAVADIPMDEEYEIYVNHEDFINQEKTKVIDCDEFHCKLCVNNEVFNLEPAAEKPICGKDGGNIIVRIADSLTSDPVHEARVSTLLLKNDYTRLNDVLITEKPMPTNKNGTFKIPVDFAGVYEITIVHPLFKTTEKRSVNVSCPTVGKCGCVWEVEHPLTQKHCEDTFLSLTVSDEVTGRVIPGALVDITLMGSKKIPLLVQEKSDVNGVVKVDLKDINMGVFSMDITKPGFYPKKTMKFIKINPDNCGDVNPKFDVTLEAKHCKTPSQHSKIFVTDYVNKLPLANVPVKLRLIQYANGATHKNVGGQLKTDVNGTVMPILYADGTYQVELESPVHRDYIPKEIGFTVNSTAECKDITIPMELIPTVPDVCSPTMTVTVKDNSTRLPVPGARVNLTLTVPKSKSVDGITSILVGQELETDQNGVIEYKVSTYGNLTAEVKSPLNLLRGGFYPATGKTEIICDGLNCKACKLSLTVYVTEVTCPANKVTVTVIDQLTKEPLSNTLVKYALTSTPETGKTYQSFPPKKTNTAGKVSFPLKHMGNYSIQVQKEGYNTVEKPVDLDCDPRHCEACVSMYTVEVRKKYCDDVAMDLFVIDGQTNKVFSGANVSVDVIGYMGKLVNTAKTTTNATGYAKIPILGDGTYVYVIDAPGYLKTTGRQVVDMVASSNGKEPNCDLNLKITRPPIVVEDVEKCTQDGQDKIKVSLAWGTSPTLGPSDLDLYSFRVNTANLTDKCVAYYCNQKFLCGCMEFGDDVKGGQISKGVETVGFCCKGPEVYMIYVDDAGDQGRGMPGSDARITLTQGSGSEEVARVSPGTVTSGLGARYWVAGCMTITDNAPNFTPVNRFMAEDPKISDPLFCVNLLKALAPAQEKPVIPITVTVSNAVSSLPISGAVAKLSLLDGSTTVTEAVTANNGMAFFPVQKSGKYEILAFADGFIPDKNILTIVCSEDGFEECKGKMTISLMPTIKPGTIQMILNWDQKVNVDFLALQVATEDTTKVCKTYYGYSACKGATGGMDSKDGLKAGEVITLSQISTNAGYSYMLYASTPKAPIASTAAKLTVSDGAHASTLSLDTTSTSKDRYWFAGCLQIVGQSYQFYQVNTILDSDPSIQNDPTRLHCHSLVKSKAGSAEVPKPFCENSAITIVVSDATTLTPVRGATVTVSRVTDTEVTVLSTDLPVNTQGKTSVAITSNGRYQFKVSANGYVIDSDQVIVACTVDTCARCSHTVYVSLSPTPAKDTVRVMLGWGEMPNNWDLRAYQVNANNPKDTCMLSSKSTCPGSVGPKDQQGSNGMETMDLGDKSKTYLVYVKNSCGIPYSAVSASHITITNGADTKKAYLDVPNYKKETYWLIGCIRVGESGYAYDELNQFTSMDPATEGNMMTNYCYNIQGNQKNSVAKQAIGGQRLIKTKTKPVNVYVKVQDPTTGKSVPTTSVTVSMTSTSYNSTVQTTTNAKGLAKVPVYKNGHYQILLDDPAHFESTYSFNVNCYGKPACKPRKTFALTPRIVTPGDVRILTTWSGKTKKIGQRIFQVTSKIPDCTSGNDIVCGQVRSETPKGIRNAFSMFVPSNNNNTSYMIYVKDQGRSRKNFDGARVSVNIFDSAGSLQVKMPSTSMQEQTLDSALLFGKWRTMKALTAMSDSDKRNTLIVQMHSQSNIAIKDLQSLTSTGRLGSLTGLAAISGFLTTRKIRTVAELNKMGREDQRNTLIADLSNNVGLDTTMLQSLSDFELATQGFRTSFYNKREIIPASYGQNYWLVGCMSNANGKMVFKPVNQFIQKSPAGNRLFCHNLLKMKKPEAEPTTFWTDKVLKVHTRNAIDNTISPACLDVTYKKLPSAMKANRVVTERIVLQHACSTGSSPIAVPLANGAGLYSLVFSGKGMVGFTEEVEVDEKTPKTTTVAIAPVADTNVYSCDQNKLDKPQYCLCRPGERVSVFESKHDNGAEDRVWSLQCASGSAKYTAKNTNAWYTQQQANLLDKNQKWDGRATNSFLVGMKSIHDNKKEDRRYTLFTASSNGRRLTNCKHKTLNRYDKPIKYALKDGQVIAGVSSHHSNRHEDRVFKIRVCKLTQDSRTAAAATANRNVYSCQKNKKDKPQYCLCQPGERLSVFKSKHYNGVEDRVWSLKCAAGSAKYTAQDPHGWYTQQPANAFDKEQKWDGRATNSFLVGMKSIHNNKKEDRQYTLFTASSNDLHLENCKSEKLNDFDKAVNRVLAASEVIAGVSSVHNNRKEDRSFTIVVCSLNQRFSYYTAMSPVPMTGTTRAMLTWGGSIENIGFSMYQVNTRLASSAPGCHVAGGSFACKSVKSNAYSTQKGSQGGTTYTVTNEDSYNYMLIASLPKTSQGLSSLKMMITNGQSTSETRLSSDRGPGQFWIIGCLTGSGTSNYKYVPVNKVIKGDPTKENPQYCSKLFIEKRTKTFPANVFIRAQVNDALTNLPVLGATVKSTFGSGITGAGGEAMVPVFANGYHRLKITMAGYSYNWVIVKVQCDSSMCSPTSHTSMVPKQSPLSAVINLGWDSMKNKPVDMSMHIYTVDTATSDKYCVTKPTGSTGACAENAPKYIVNSKGKHHTADTVSLSKINPRSSLSYMVAVSKAGRPSKAVLDIANSVVTYQDAHRSQKVLQSMKFDFEDSLRGVIMFGEWQTVSEIFRKTTNDQRNTLIMLLDGWTSLSVSNLQSMNNADLQSIGWITAFLKVYSILPKSSLMFMNVLAQRKAFIQAVSTNHGALSAYRQARGNMYLTSLDLSSLLGKSRSTDSYQLVSQMTYFFYRKSVTATGPWWIAGCLHVDSGKMSWVPVSEYVTDVNPKFCNNLLFKPKPRSLSNLSNSGFKIMARSSQDNKALHSAKVSVSKIEASGATAVATDVKFKSGGNPPPIFVPITSNGKYGVVVTVAGYITESFELFMDCKASRDCKPERLVTMSPTMEAGQTRIIMNWLTTTPKDMDIHLMSFKLKKNSNQINKRKSCDTYWNKRTGCKKVKLDLDNTHGGEKGAETITLLDSTVNSGYKYAIGVLDYSGNKNGMANSNFLSSGVTVRVINGQQKAEKKLKTSVSQLKNPKSWWFVGCVDVDHKGGFRFTPAVDGTFFNGAKVAEWGSMMDQHCGKAVELQQSNKAADQSRSHSSAPVVDTNVYKCNQNKLDKPQYCLCRPGERVSVFKSKHDNGAEDRVWSLQCASGSAKYAAKNANAWYTQQQANLLDKNQKWDGRKTNSFLVGMKSIHDNKKEDRRYTLFTASSNGRRLTNCKRKTLNRYDKPIKYALKDGQVIAGVSSHHSNRHEDRVFKIRVCKLTQDSRTATAGTKRHGNKHSGTKRHGHKRRHAKRHGHKHKGTKRHSHKHRSSKRRGHNRSHRHGRSGGRRSSGRRSSSRRSSHRHSRHHHG